MTAAINSVTRTTAFLIRHVLVVSRTGRTSTMQLLLIEIVTSKLNNTEIFNSSNEMNFFSVVASSYELYFFNSNLKLIYSL